MYFDTPATNGSITVGTNPPFVLCLRLRVAARVTRLVALPPIFGRTSEVDCNRSTPSVASGW